MREETGAKKVSALYIPWKGAEYAAERQDSGEGLLYTTNFGKLFARTTN